MGVGVGGLQGESEALSQTWIWRSHGSLLARSSPFLVCNDASELALDELVEKLAECVLRIESERNRRPIAVRVSNAGRRQTLRPMSSVCSLSHSPCEANTVSVVVGIRLRAKTVLAS